jgi:hypothetical protein
MVPLTLGFMASATLGADARLSVRFIWIFARVSRHSAEAERILAREKIGPAEYFNPETRVPHRVMMDLLRPSIEGGDPEIGLRAGASLQPGDFAILEYAARSCSTLREAMACFARYVSLLNEAAEEKLVEEGDRAIWRHHVIDGVPQSPAANDFVVAAADAFAKTYCNVYEPPLEVLSWRERHPSRGEIAGHAARRTYRWCRPPTLGSATTLASSRGSISRVTGASPSRLMCGRSSL